LSGKSYVGYSRSIWPMLEIIEKLREAKSGEAVIAIEI